MFQKATKTRSRARIGLIGPSGSGKTWTALLIGTYLAEQFGGRVAFIDTEHGSASKYADNFDFDVLELEEFDPRDYIKAIEAAADMGYSVVIVDSLSHAWVGKRGALELVDEASKRRSGNSFTAWREVTPLHNQLIDAIVGARCHVICTMRSKTEYVLEEDGKGRKVPRKVGMAPVQRDGMEYEFDIVGDLDWEHNLIISKSRCPQLADRVFSRPGRDVAEIIHAWLSDGVEAPAPQPCRSASAPAPNTGNPEVTAIREALKERGVTWGQIRDSLSDPSIQFPADMTVEAWRTAGEILLKTNGTEAHHGDR